MMSQHSDNVQLFSHPIIGSNTVGEFSSECPLMLTDVHSGGRGGALGHCVGEHTYSGLCRVMTAKCRPILPLLLSTYFVINGFYTDGPQSDANCFLI